MLPDSAINAGAAAIREGAVVAFPTETVYGLGANAYDPIAVARVFELKGRPRFDPLIAHVASETQAAELVARIPDSALALMRAFWPGPLTLVLPKSDRVPDLVTAGLATVAVRLPAHPVAHALIERAGVPIAAPSANRFGGISPTTAAHVRAAFGASLRWVLDAGPCPVGVESTVVAVDAETGRCVLLRAGGIALESLRAVRDVDIPSSPLHRIASPGQLDRHYAPSTPLDLLGAAPEPGSNERVGLLAWRRPDSNEGYAAVEILSETGDLREAAAALFAAMHRLDALGLDRIVAIPVPETGLGLAIMDRLRRASHRG
ncbi:MAG: threonylcarbamoyl-AMP synthase [Planctomycetes bacterium]|nr:threonylcarbamoyl-AMP synthase [Planctomycetota bacterium]